MEIITRVETAVYCHMSEAQRAELLGLTNRMVETIMREFDGPPHWKKPLKKGAKKK